MDPFSLIGEFLNKAKGQLGDSLSKMVPQSEFKFDYTHPSSQKAAPSASPQAPKKTAPPAPSLSQQATSPVLPALRGFGGEAPMPGEQLHALIAKHRGADTPILNDLGTLIAAGNQLPENLDPLLPIILAIRETQGGKFNKGQNNPYNIRGDQLGQTGKFIDYPDVQTATLGGHNPMGNVESQGLAGLLGKNKIYSDFRQSGRLQDLFAHYSPTADSNGSLDQQAENYKWIRNQILGLSNS